MSGCSSETDCPNCGSNAYLYVDWKPFDYCSITCPHCGLYIYPKTEYMNLKTLNEFREEQGLPKLRKKPKQRKDIY